MPVEAPGANHAPLLYRTAPFSAMDPARRFQLLWQSRAVHYGPDEEVFSAAEAPGHVLIIFEGQVSVFGELAAEVGPVLLDELGPGECAGWSAALSGAPGLRAVTTSEVDGLLVPAAAFLEITRYDVAIKEAVYSRAWKAEVWRAVLAEMRRRLGPVRSARGIVEGLQAECVARDWPDDQEQIAAAEGKYTWVAVGGEGVSHGDRWSGGEGVLWARLIGLPEQQLAAAFEVLGPAFPTGPEISPARSAEPVVVEQTRDQTPRPAPVSSSERRVQSVVAKRSQIAPGEDPMVRADRLWMRVLTGFVTVILFIGASIAWWASEQRVIQTISLPGRLAFTGEIRPLYATMAGTLTELNVRAGQRVEAGAVLAVIRPFIDEQKLRQLEGQLAQARGDAAFCDAFLAGQIMRQDDASESLQILARQHAEASSELRVLGAIQRGGGAIIELTPAERQRVDRYFKEIRSAQSARLDAVARDAAVRVEDLREAEQALREAQGEVRTHQQSFAGARTEDKKEAAQEKADYRRVLGVLNREVGQRQEVVNRLRRELQVMRAESEPLFVTAEDKSAEILSVQEKLAGVEEQLKRQLVEARKAAEATAVEIEKLRAAAAPHQIVARASGFISEANGIPIGAAVESDAILAQLVLRETWEIQCAISLSQMALLAPGQPIRIAYTDPKGTPISCIETLVLTGGRDIRLQLRTTREEWRDGMPVQIEADLVKGNLLEQWLGRI